MQILSLYYVFLILYGAVSAFIGVQRYIKVIIIDIDRTTIQSLQRLKRKNFANFLRFRANFVFARVPPTYLF